MAARIIGERLIDATKGRGCSHCEIGQPIDYSERSKVVIKICLECVLLWFAGWTVTEWEASHAPFADHLGDHIEAAIEKEMRDVSEGVINRELRKEFYADVSRK